MKCVCGHSKDDHWPYVGSGCMDVGCLGPLGSYRCGCRDYREAPAGVPAPPDATERRRYALLQAAAVLLSADHWQGARSAVHEAHLLLAEIEERESAKESKS